MTDKADNGGRNEPETNASGFDDVLNAEWDQIEDRRREAFTLPKDPGAADKQESVGAKQPESTAGLAFSGGGLRSASFCMGITQAFHKTGLWRFFDYLSTVSGGGYTGAHISSAAIKNKKRIGKERDAQFPLPAKSGDKESPESQPDEVKRFIYGGRYLMRGWQLANKYLIGFLLSNLTLFSGLVAACALIAFIWRCLDYPGIRERLRPLAHATELKLNGDFIAAFYPFIFFTTTWIIAWIVSCLRRGSEASGRVARMLLFWVVASLLIGIALVLSNGDAPGFFLGFDPSQWGARFWGPVSALVAGSLIPFLSPKRLMQSGLNPKNQFEKITFRIASTGLLIGLPLLLIGFFGRENISGYHDSDRREVVPNDIAWNELKAGILDVDFLDLKKSPPPDQTAGLEGKEDHRIKALQNPDGVLSLLTEIYPKDNPEEKERQFYQETLAVLAKPIKAALVPHVELANAGKRFNDEAENLLDIFGNEDIDKEAALSELDGIEKDKLRRLFLAESPKRHLASRESQKLARYYLAWLCTHLTYQEQRIKEARETLEGERPWSRWINRERMRRTALVIEWMVGLQPRDPDMEDRDGAAEFWHWSNQQALTKKLICDSLNEFLRPREHGPYLFQDFSRSLPDEPYTGMGANLGGFLEAARHEDPTQKEENQAKPVDPNPLLSKFLWGRLSPAVQARLEAAKELESEDFADDEDFLIPLQKDLDDILEGGKSLYDARITGDEKTNLFTAAKLRKSTTDLIAELEAAKTAVADPGGANPTKPVASATTEDLITHLNVQLLEDAYPDQLNRSFPIHLFPAFKKRNPATPLRTIVIYEDQTARLKVFGIALLLFAVGLFVDLNFTSMHGYYRRRIASAFIVPEGKKRESPMLSSLRTTDFGYPYHLISATLHTPRASLSDLVREATSASVREENAEKPQLAPFLFSGRYCGSEVTGYRPTKEFEELPVGDLSNIDLADAAALSGGAMSPGQVQNLLLGFLMFVLNLRLGQWLPNPSRDNPKRRPHLGNILKNAAFRHPRNRDYVFVSDGGHSENLGLVPLLQRHCRLIVAIDASNDPGHDFADLARAIRFSRIEAGIKIEPLTDSEEFETDDFVAELDLDQEVDDSGNIVGSAKHFTLARIRYPDSSIADGLLVYVKPSLTGDESVDLIQYARSHPEFPHEATSDQEFEMEQVESYRQLGYHIGRALCELLPRVAKHGDLWEESGDPAVLVENICGEFEASWTEKPEPNKEKPSPNRETVTELVKEALARELAKDKPAAEVGIGSEVKLEHRTIEPKETTAKKVRPKSAKGKSKSKAKKKAKSKSKSKS